jgi:hypothetical protein
MRYVASPFMWSRAGSALMLLNTEPARGHIRHCLQRALEGHQLRIFVHSRRRLWPSGVRESRTTMPQRLSSGLIVPLPSVFSLAELICVTLTPDLVRLGGHNN